MRFVSGLSYYTYFLSKSLAVSNDVSVILVRNLVPRFVYPGRARVGAPISKLATADFAPTFDGLDWYVVPSLMKATRFFRRLQPEVLILQWWSAACLPAYLALTREARRHGVPVVVEFHENVHPAEARVPVLGELAAVGLRQLVKRGTAYVVHSEQDRSQFCEQYALSPESVSVVPLGPFPLAHKYLAARSSNDPITILFFGTIRPYKGLEDLVDAFDILCQQDPGRWRLLIVGEPWEHWTLPFEKIKQSAHRADIQLVDRYVTDEELPYFFGRADLVALPYLESAASGPLHITMATGLPVVVTTVGGLVSAVQGYSGAVQVPPSDPTALARGVTEAARLTGRRHEDLHSWHRTQVLFDALITRLVE
jgi:glycosyltransferase involved in cell wall biosynthesis